MIILALLNVYLPGYKAGGPVQSVANLTERLGKDFHVKIVTTDRDYGDSQGYSSVRTGEWQKIGKAEVLYVQSGSLWNLRRIINRTKYDVLYLNSFFHPAFTLFPLLLWKTGMLRSTPLVIAPRGELSPGALQIKHLRKRTYLNAARVLRVYNGVLWQATSWHEEAEIRHWFPGDLAGRKTIVVAPDLLSHQLLNKEVCSRREKQRGHLRLLFASRISPKKNLAGALRCLGGVQGTIDFEICGPVGDEGYWNACQEAMKDLPGNVQVKYLGPIPHDQLMEQMTQYDLFFLPTLGENFGHAIVEALSAGCPVLISDQTPWRNLASQYAGWDLPVGHVNSFRDAVQRCIDMADEEHQKWRAGAKRLATTIVDDAAAAGQNEDVFIHALQCSPASTRKRSRKPQNTSKDLCRNHFDDMADRWETKYEAGGSLRQRATSFVRCLRALVDAPGQVLDFGCGSGDIATACAKAGYRVSGVDLSPAMIARARLRANGNGIGFDVLESDEPLRLPHAGARFDAVIASSVLEYVRDPLDCFRELWRVCRPNGVLLATVPNLRHPLRWLEVALRQPLIRRGFSAKNRWQRYLEYLDISGNRFRREHWSDLLRRAGWQLEAVRARSKPLVMLVARRPGLGTVHGEINDPPCAESVLEV